MSEAFEGKDLDSPNCIYCNNYATCLVHSSRSGQKRYTLDGCQFFIKRKNCYSCISKEEDNLMNHAVGEYDNVSHPSHYTAGRKYEPRLVIEDWGLGFYLGNVVKYISRAGRKGDAVEDLKKARQYLDWEIEKLENS